MADEAYCVGPAPSVQSYLDQDKILDVISRSGANGVHPGYGFLSENGAFVERLNSEFGGNVAWIGPNAKAIEAMGDKIESKRLADSAGVNTIPGFLGECATDEEVLKVANEIGYPVMIKASAGGGGKGMRVATDDKSALEGFRLSQAEAESSFGDKRMLVEKFIEEPRHIEIQVLGDKHKNVVYLNERECSIQRRNQKVLEESPSSFITPELRKAMGEQAVALAQAVDYDSAGTCEMLVDKHGGFYFLEMNTRLQVEHPVTELITGVDLVEQMIRSAANEPLNFTQADVGINGWATEARVYAEDPYQNYLPSIGTLWKYKEPTLDGSDPQGSVPVEDGGVVVRCDSGIVEGSEISMYYDPMICKLITHAPTRQQSIEVLREALDRYIIDGVEHNIPLLRDLLEHPKYVAGEINTNFLPEEYPDGFHGYQLQPEDTDALVAMAASIHTLETQRKVLGGDKVTYAPHANEDARPFVVTIDGFDGEQRVATQALPSGDGGDLATGFFVYLGGENSDNAEFNRVELLINYTTTNPVVEGVLFNGAAEVLADANAQGEEPPQVPSTMVTVQVIAKDQQSYTLQYKGTKFTVHVRHPLVHDFHAALPEKEKPDLSNLLMSPMPGLVKSVNVQVGDQLSPGQEVLVLEAMKMQNVIRAPGDKVVKAIHVGTGDKVQADEVLIEYE